MRDHPIDPGSINWRKLQTSALAWLRSLPPRFQDEPELWGYATTREVEGCIPTITFCL